MLHSLCTDGHQVMLGGEWFEEQFGNPADVSEDTMAQVAKEELQHHLGIEKQPITVISRIHKVSISSWNRGHLTLHVNLLMGVITICIN